MISPETVVSIFSCSTVAEKKYAVALRSTARLLSGAVILNPFHAMKALTVPVVLTVSPPKLEIKGLALLRIVPGEL